MQPLQRREGDAARFTHFEPGPGKQVAQFARRDEILPVVRAPWHQSQALGRADQQQPRLRRAVRCGQDHQPAGCKMARQRGDEGRFVGHMLEHFHRAHQVKLPEAQAAEFACEVIDGQARACGMGLRRGNVFPRRIDAGHRRAEPGERFAQQPCAATDIERAFAGERFRAGHIAAPVAVDSLADKAESHRVQLVQHGRGALRIPPVARQGGEVRGFMRPDGCRRYSCIRHSPLLTARTVHRQQGKITAWLAS